MLCPMTRTLADAFVAALLVGPGFPVALAQGGDDPEAVIRQLVSAIYSHDVEAYPTAERADEAARERACGGVRGAQPSDG